MAGEQRKLAAILVADVAGYSRLVGSDEAGTLAKLHALRSEVIEPTISKYAGRLFKAVGDGFLVEFASAVQAVSCASAMQDANTGELKLRIGIHLGDVVVQGDDLMGDGVNIAARVEGVAEPGGIAISRAVHEQVRDKLNIKFIDKGQVELKNLVRPVRVFAFGGTKPAEAPALALPDKPSIAVLPFQNMSGDLEQEYFVDGLVEDIITALSRFKSLFVIARNSSFSYKGKSPDIRQVGRELGVRYVLEGSVRKSAGRVRITGQLIEAATGAHLWADRFEGTLEDVFELQDKVTLGIVSFLDHSIASSESARALRKTTSDLGATDLYYRALAALYRYTSESVDEAEALFAKAAAADPGFAAAYGIATWCHIGRKARGWPRDPIAAAAETRRLANLAWEADKDDAFAIGIAGYALAFVAGDLETGKAWLDRSVSINPNIAGVLAFAAMVNNFSGEPGKAIEYAERAYRLNPRDPRPAMIWVAAAHGYYFAGRPAEAARWALMELAESPANPVALRIGAAGLAMAGDIAQATKLAARLSQVDPTLRLSNLAERLGPYKSAQAIELYAEGLRRAGLATGSAPATTSALALPDKPSIAVLPFQNMSGDPEQEYFADGMVEDIITALSRARSLFVIARNSSFTYKGKAVDIKQVGRELGVLYVLEGSVRKVGNKVRISGQLIEAATGMHLWADRFDGLLGDIFELQDRITACVIAAILPQVERAEIERAQRMPTESLRAYDYYLRALAASYRFTREANLEVVELTRAANRIDPKFALSHALAAFSFTQRRAFGWSTDMADDFAEARRLSNQAIEFGKDDARVLGLAGFSLSFLADEVERGATLVSQAIQLEPSLALARQWMGWINVFLGEHDAAIEQIQVALRLNPLDPRRYSALAAMAFALFHAGRDEEAWNLASTVVRLQPNYLTGQRIMLATCAMTGRIDEARKALAIVMQMAPTERVSTLKSILPRRSQDIRKIEEAFRIAGMPE